jgi:hypothetical protein
MLNRRDSPTPRFGTPLEIVYGGRPIRRLNPLDGRYSDLGIFGQIGDRPSEEGAGHPNLCTG